MLVIREAIFSRERHSYRDNDTPHTVNSPSVIKPSQAMSMAT